MRIMRRLLRGLDEARRHEDQRRWASIAERLSRRNVRWAMASAVVTLLGIAVAVVTAWRPPAMRGSQLELVDARAIGSAEVEVAVTDALEPGSEETVAVSDNGLDISVRNTGDTVAVVSAVRFRVERVEELSMCENYGDELSVSQVYDVPLAPRGFAGATIEAPVSQEVPAGQADRFVVTTGAPGEIDNAAIYVVWAALVVNGDDLLDLGRFVIGSQFPLRDTYFYATIDPACERANARKLDEVLGLDAEMSEELAMVNDRDAILAGAQPPEGGTMIESVRTCGSVTTDGGDVVVARVSRDDGVPCDEVLDVVGRYFDEVGRSGSANVAQVDDWSCGDTTAIEQDHGYITRCQLTSAPDEVGAFISVHLPPPQ